MAISVPQRTLTLRGGIWADNANTTIPSPPVAGLAYRNTSLDNSKFAEGQAYKSIGDSALWNQYLWKLGGLMDLLEQYGVLPWSPSITYPPGAVVLGPDGNLYFANNSNTNSNPSGGSNSNWTSVQKQEGDSSDAGGGSTGLGETYYVNELTVSNAPSNRDGKSWSTAWRNLEEAFTALNNSSLGGYGVATMSAGLSGVYQRNIQYKNTDNLSHTMLSFMGGASLAICIQSSSSYGIFATGLEAESCNIGIYGNGKSCYFTQGMRCNCAALHLGNNITVYTPQLSAEVSNIGFEDNTKAGSSTGGTTLYTYSNSSSGFVSLSSAQSRFNGTCNGRITGTLRNCDLYIGSSSSGNLRISGLVHQGGYGLLGGTSLSIGASYIHCPISVSTLYRITGIVELQGDYLYVTSSTTVVSNTDGSALFSVRGGYVQFSLGNISGSNTGTKLSVSGGIAAIVGGSALSSWPGTTQTTGYGGAIY